VLRSSNILNTIAKSQRILILTYIFEYSCGYERETPKYVTVFCLRYHDSREQLRINGRLGFSELLTTAEGVRKVTRWWLRRRVLEQFWLAEELIEN
jgi:hypothetical protein